LRISIFTNGSEARFEMRSNTHIRYLHRARIDVRRWDDCIERSPNALLYGRAFFLDVMTGRRWDALVLDDYAAVMPLPWRRKAGFRYLYQPPYMQQSGVFSPAPVSPEIVMDFLQQLPRHFRFAEIFLNYGNYHPLLSKHANFILRLEAPYPRLAAQYRKDLVRNLRRAEQFGLEYLTDPALTPALERYRLSYGDRTPHVRERDYRRFHEVCSLIQEKGQLVIRGVSKGQQPIATAILLRDRHRLYLLQSTTLPAGRELEANHYLLDRLIREWAGSGLTLDFEGSDLPGIAHFYKNFGSIDQPYYFYRYNHLPWPVGALKDKLFIKKQKHGF
jgi:hypothetical protein